MKLSSEVEQPFLRLVFQMNLNLVLHSCGAVIIAMADLTRGLFMVAVLCCWEQSGVRQHVKYSAVFVVINGQELIDKWNVVVAVQRSHSGI